MAEVEIKRVNFFDGQFLKQGEFMEEQLYHRHMRQRLNYMLFERSGVVPDSPTSLEFINIVDTTFQIGAGMAISRKDDPKEGIEVILREDSDVYNLAPFGLTGTVWVTVHYGEIPAEDPPSEGERRLPTRITETANITLHHNINPSGNTADNGEEYIVLGSVNLATMHFDRSTYRQVTRIRPALLGPTAAISVSQSTVVAGQTVTLTVTSSGGFDLSSVTLQNVTISPTDGITDFNNDGIPDIEIAQGGQASFTLSFTLEAGAPSGSRTLTVTIGVNSASTSFAVEAGLSLIDFEGVDETRVDDNGDPDPKTTLDIIGTGFGAEVRVQLTSRLGGLTSEVIADRRSPTLIQIEMGNIPDDATYGPIRVTSDDTTIEDNDNERTINIMPPARIDGFEPSQVEVDNLLTIDGSVFLPGSRGLTITFPNGTFKGTASDDHPFPSEPGESRTEMEIQIRIPTGEAATGPVVVTTDGGVVESDLEYSLEMS